MCLPYWGSLLVTLECAYCNPSLRKLRPLYDGKLVSNTYSHKPSEIHWEASYWSSLKCLCMEQEAPFPLCFCKLLYAIHS